MAVIRDVMPAFQLFQPGSIAEAQKLLEQHGQEAWVMAGRLDGFDWLRTASNDPGCWSIPAGSRVAEVFAPRTTESKSAP